MNSLKSLSKLRWSQFWLNFVINTYCKDMKTKWQWWWFNKTIELTCEWNLITAIYWLGVESRTIFIVLICSECGEMNRNNSLHDIIDGTESIPISVQPSKSEQSGSLQKLMVTISRSGLHRLLSSKLRSMKDEWSKKKRSEEKRNAYQEKIHCLMRFKRTCYKSYFTTSSFLCSNVLFFPPLRPLEMQWKNFRRFRGHY